MKKIVIFVSLTLLLILSVTVYSNQATKENSQQNKDQPTKTANEQPNTNDDAGKAFAPPKIQNVPKIHTQEASTPNSQDQQKWYDKIFEILAIPTLTDWLLVTFNGILAFFTFRLWKSTGKADQTARLRDRARLYLSPSVLPYPPPPRDVTHWGIFIVIENVGVMPVKKVKLKCAFTYSEKTKWTQAEWKVFDSLITIGQKRSLPIQGRDIPIDIINKIVTGKAEVFIMAEAIYVDEFFPGEDRITQMNVRLNVDNAGGYSFGYSPEHNCTDDDCN